MFQLSQKALVGSLGLSLILGLLLAITAHRLSSAKEVIQDLTKWQGQLVNSIGLAAGNPKVTKDTAQLQVQAMGRSIAELHGAIDTQNGKIAALGAQREAAMKLADQVRAQRAAAIKQADQLALDLENQARAPVPHEQLELELRRIQDEVYDAGL